MSQIEHRQKDQMNELQKEIDQLKQTITASDGDSISYVDQS